MPDPTSTPTPTPTRGDRVLLLVTMLLPVGLLLLMLLMERVERPLRAHDTSRQVTEFLQHARPEDIEALVSDGYDVVLQRYWRRRRVLPLPLPLRRGRGQDDEVVGSSMTGSGTGDKG